MFMNTPTGNKAFIFNEEIDTQRIIDLYADDYVYIEEVFDTVLLEYEVLADNICSCHASGNIPALKSAVHKIKPIFGFVGLIEMQDQCQQFENSCQDASSVDSLAGDYKLLSVNLIKNKLLIEKEKGRLELFNNPLA
jgi:HPt (histidine-containing phosphotransfer) domain-containing protein